MAGSKPVVRQGALTVGLAVLLVGSLLEQLPALASARGSKGTGFDALESSAGRWLLAQLNPSSPSDEEQLEELIRREGPLRAKGAYAEAALLWEKILTIAERTVGPNHPKLGTCLNNLAFLYSEQGRYREAEPLYKRAIAISEKAEGPEHPSTADSMNNLAILYMKMGFLGEAEILYKRSLGIWEKILGPNHDKTSLGVHNLAHLFSEQGRYREAEPLYKRAIAISEKAVGPQHPSTATSLNNLAELYKAQGRYGEAEPLYKRSLAIWEKTLGPEHPRTATGLNNLAELYKAQGRYGEAEPLFKRSLAILEKALGPEHPDTANSLNNLAQLYRAQGRYGEAEPLFKRSLAILEKALGPEHPDTANSLNNLAQLYQAQDRYREAELLNKSSLEISLKVLGPNHPTTATILDNLATIYSRQGRHDKAISLYNNSLESRKKVLGSEHPDTITSVNNLAVAYIIQGRYGEAETLLKKSLAISEKLGTVHSNAAGILNNLGSLFHKQGRYEEAEVFFKRSLAIREKLLGPYHPDIANTLNNLASIYVDQGRDREAESFYKRALAISEKVLGPEHTDAAITANNLASLLKKKGRPLEAELLYMRSLTQIEKALGTQHPFVATVLDNLAWLYVAPARYEIVETLFKRSLAIREKTFSSNHPDIAGSLENLAFIYLLQTKVYAAEPLLQKFHRYQLGWLLRELPLQPRSLRIKLVNQQRDAASTTFTLLDQHPAAAPLALETRLNRQGLLAEIERRQALLSASSPETLRLAEQAAAIDQNLSSITLVPAQREALRQQRQQLEAQLYRLLPALKIDPVSNAQVATALKAAAPQGLLVEFQKYRPYEKDVKGIPNLGAERYVALLLKPEGTIRAIPLGEAKAIDEAVNTALAATVKNEQRQTQALTVLSQRILGPLQPHLNGVKVLFLSPDGELNRVPFAALPSPMEPGRYLSEAFQLRILTTGRDLVRLQQPNQAAGSQPAGSNVLMADPEFGPITGASSTPTLPAWLPLPYTSAEAEQLKGLLNVPEPFLGREATAARVLRTRGPRILHIATHGYFQPEAVTTSVPRLRASSAADGSGFATALINQPNSQLQLESQEPLQRIFLALAGANIPNTNAADDGRLTAAEATGMDLAGTELVTLSACDTARGEIRSGEGVYGLQRALTVAGARSTLLSLWRVGDQRTAVFMAEFYKRLKAGQPRADALRDTQAFFRKHPDSTYRDVYAWGGFQLTGDWRPVEGL